MPRPTLLQVELWNQRYEPNSRTLELRGHQSSIMTEVNITSFRREKGRYVPQIAASTQHDPGRGQYPA
jgi:hypothetical protein